MRVFALILTLLLPITACAQELPEKFVEGTHYTKIANPIKTSSDKIEVVEFFWYGCGHCFHFEASLEPWVKKLPEDVSFVRSPAVWRPVMAEHAKVLFTAQALGKEQEIHEKFFTAMNVDRKPLNTADEIQAFFVGLGVDAEKFKKIYTSFAVTNQVSIADSRARSVPIEGTPEMLIDGKYRLTARAAGGQEQMLQVADFLIDKIRSEKKPK